MRLGLALVAAGMVSTVGCGGPSPVTCDNLPANVTYDNKVKDFLDTNCTSCHSSTKTNYFARQRAPKGVDFDTYDAAKTNGAKGADEVQNGNMPQDKKLSDSDRCILRAWVQQGMPQQ